LYVPPARGSIHDGIFVLRIASNGSDRTVTLLGFDKGYSYSEVAIPGSIDYLGFS